MPLTVAKYGDQPLLVVSFSDEAGRDWVTQSPSRGDDHLVQERGLRQRRTSVEIVFCDQPGLGDYLERWLAFRAAAESPRPALFVHPLQGSYLAAVDGLQARVELPERAVRVSCTFVAAAPPVAVFTIGAGVVPQAGPEAVQVAAERADAELAAIGATSATPAACLTAVQAWADAEQPDARVISVQAAGLASQLDDLITAYELATDLDRWAAYRSVIGLRAQVVRAAAAVTADTAVVRRYTVAVAEPLRAIVARLFGARDAETRTLQVQRLNGLRSPGMVPAGTELQLPTGDA